MRQVAFAFALWAKSFGWSGVEQREAYELGNRQTKHGISKLLLISQYVGNPFWLV